jgi:hypothetical protein
VRPASAAGGPVPEANLPSLTAVLAEKSVSAEEVERRLALFVRPHEEA